MHTNISAFKSSQLDWASDSMEGPEPHLVHTGIDAVKLIELTADLDHIIFFSFTDRLI